MGVTRMCVCVCVMTYDAQKPHLGEAGGGVVCAVVELGHLIIFPGFISVGEECSPLGVESTDGLQGEREGRQRGRDKET